MTAVTDAPILPRYSPRTMIKREELDNLIGMYGLRCPRCHFVIYSNKRESANEAFNMHDCQLKQAEVAEQESPAAV